MIFDVPSPTEFRDHGTDYLNIGWREIHDVEALDSIASDFWSAAKRELATALALMEQGAEFLLKSKICEMSPWLLVAKNPNEWPKCCAREEVRFAQFRTIDAEDLVKVHDTFGRHRLDEEFRQIFDQLRQLRNSAISAFIPFAFAPF